MTRLDVSDFTLSVTPNVERIHPGRVFARDVEIHVRSVPALRWPYQMEALFAEAENDRDVAGGRPVTGPELDWLEQAERTLARAEDDLFLFGNAFVRVDRGA